MNQRISLILNGVLAIAVIVLYVLHFKGQKASPDVEATDSTQTAEAPLIIDSLPNIVSGNGAIAYIDYEQLTTKYQFYKDGVANLESDYKKKQQDLMKRQETLEQNAANYQQVAGGLTPDVREKRERMLMEEDQKLREYADKLDKEWSDKQQTFAKNLLTKLDEYLKVLSKEKNYAYVFTYTKGGPANIVYAKDSLNISTQVINGLNAQYKKK
ncbi:MAG: OmpH family outer membrane protein [Cytophaga sp.]|uniref:OmpH family outer membrane protein n=1 Tax=Cytophaga sp. TaxID=29535 RepID=UPI003F82049D